MQSWIDTGNLNVAREGHTATLLQDGRVLVFGGYGGSVATMPVPLRSAELYHPHMGTWSFTGSTFYERSGHTATLLPNGKVLVVGGTIVLSRITNTELYDPTSGEWYATGRLNVARPMSHAATQLADGRVLVVGGYDQTVPYPDCFLSSAEVYDPVTQVWSIVGNLTYGRYNPTATLLPDGKVLVVGGGGSNGFHNTAELFDPATESWTLTGGLFYYRFGHTATRLRDGKVLVTGGLTYSPYPNPHNFSLNTSELYDPASGNWYSVGKLNVARRYHSAALLHDGRVLVAGGEDHDLYSGGYLKLKSTETYDPDTFVWTSAGDLSTERIGHTETLLRGSLAESVLQESRILIAGGDNASSYSNTLSSAELFWSESERPAVMVSPAA